MTPEANGHASRVDGDHQLQPTSPYTSTPPQSNLGADYLNPDPSSSPSAASYDLNAHPNSSYQPSYHPVHQQFGNPVESSDSGPPAFPAIPSTSAGNPPANASSAPSSDDPHLAEINFRTNRDPNTFTNQHSTHPSPFQQPSNPSPQPQPAAPSAAESFVDPSQDSNRSNARGSPSKIGNFFPGAGGAAAGTAALSLIKKVANGSSTNSNGGGGGEQHRNSNGPVGGILQGFVNGGGIQEGGQAHRGLEAVVSTLDGFIGDQHQAGGAGQQEHVGGESGQRSGFGSMVGNLVGKSGGREGEHSGSGGGAGALLSNLLSSAGGGGGQHQQDGQQQPQGGLAGVAVVAAGLIGNLVKGGRSNQQPDGRTGWSGHNPNDGEGKV